MSNEQDAWMPLWIGSYLADTTDLTRDQHGGYLLLLMAYWRKGKPLPDDDNRLAAITKASPEEWRERLRPILSEFFQIADGVWSHKRVEVELVEAANRAEGASKKAKAAAEARWAKERAAKEAAEHAAYQMRKQCTEHAPSIAGANPEQCPTPTPSPTPISPTGDISPLPPAEAAGLGQGVGFVPTPAGVICKALKAAGIASVAPGNQSLLTLLEAGATLDEFLALTDQARTKGKPFTWLMATLINQRKQAAEDAKAMHKGPMTSQARPAKATNALLENDHGGCLVDEPI